MGKTLAMILAGGAGTRLEPLTRERAKPAVPFGGPLPHHRLRPLQLRQLRRVLKMKVLTQYKSDSLNNHLSRAWRMSGLPRPLRGGGARADAHRGRLVQGQRSTPSTRTSISSPTRSRTRSSSSARTTSTGWTCDRCSTYHLRGEGRLHRGRHPGAHRGGTGLRHHRRGPGRADAGLPREAEEPAADAREPQTCAWPRWATTSSRPRRWCRRSSATRPTSRARTTSASPSSASCTSTPACTCTTSPRTGPGQEPKERGYWRDVGNIDVYYQANMDLVEVDPIFNLYNDRWPIYTQGSTYPPAKFVFADQENDRVGYATDTLVSEGCIISGGHVHRSRASPEGARELVLRGRARASSSRTSPIGRRCRITPRHHRQERRDPRRDDHRLRRRPRTGAASTSPREGVVVIPKGMKVG